MKKSSSSSSDKTDLEELSDVMLEHAKLERESQKDFPSIVSLSVLTGAVMCRGSIVHAVFTSFSNVPFWLKLSQLPVYSPLGSLHVLYFLSHCVSSVTTPFDFFFTAFWKTSFGNLELLCKLNRGLWDPVNPWSEFYRKIHYLTREFRVKLHAKTDIARIAKRWVRYRFSSAI